MSEANKHKLFNQLTESNATEDEIAELFEDLSYIFSSPFDNKINEAILLRGCAYIESESSLPN